jgi:CRP-like cAMP-binding protein
MSYKSQTQKRATPSLLGEFFAGIGKQQVREIQAAAKIQKMPSGRVILMEGAPPSHLYLLKQGRAKFYRLAHDGVEVLLARLSPGDVFGLGSLMARPSRYIGTAETVGRCELLVWEQATIRGLARKYPRLSQNVLGMVLRYLSTHFDRLFDLVTCTAGERLSRVLVHLGMDTGVPTDGGIEVHVTNEELAALANVSPFTVSRLMSKWARRGALAKSRRKIIVYSPEKLLDD